MSAEAESFLAPVPFRRVRRVTVDGPKPQQIAGGRTRTGRTFTVVVLRDDPMRPSLQVTFADGLMLRCTLGALVHSIIEAEADTHIEVGAELASSVGRLRASLSEMTLQNDEGASFSGLDLFGPVLDQLLEFAAGWSAAGTVAAEAAPAEPAGPCTCHFDYPRGGSVRGPSVNPSCPVHGQAKKSP